MRKNLIISIEKDYPIFNNLVNLNKKMINLNLKRCTLIIKFK